VRFPFLKKRTFGAALAAILIMKKPYPQMAQI
jgi:hypothetical protein